MVCPIFHHPAGGLLYPDCFHPGQSPHTNKIYKHTLLSLNFKPGLDMQGACYTAPLSRHVKQKLHYRNDKEVV